MISKILCAANHEDDEKSLKQIKIPTYKSYIFFIKYERSYFESKQMLCR